MGRPTHWASALLCLLLLAAHAEFSAAAARTPQDLPLKHSYPTHEKDLLEELKEVLEHLQHKKVSVWEKKFNQVPKCSFGNLCAVRKGARIGKLCNCPRGSACNTFLLKCL